MKVFGAITIVVAVMGGVLGMLLADYLLRGYGELGKGMILLVVGFAFGYVSLKGYRWLLKKPDRPRQEPPE